MPGVNQQLSEQFRAWEQRGRGGHVFPEPVFPEPPFRPFEGHFLPNAPVVDDGRKPTVLSFLARKVGQALGAPPELPPPRIIEESEPEPELLSRDTQVELQTALPADLDIPKEAFQQFLLNLALCQEPISFELIGVPKRVTVQFASHSDDTRLLQRQLQAHFPDAVFQPVKTPSPRHGMRVRENRRLRSNLALPVNSCSRLKLPSWTPLSESSARFRT